MRIGRVRVPPERARGTRYIDDACRWRFPKEWQHAACPGFTATDLNNFAGTRTVQQAARGRVMASMDSVDGMDLVDYLD